MKVIEGLSKRACSRNKRISGKGKRASASLFSPTPYQNQAPDILNLKSMTGTTQNIYLWNLTFNKKNFG